jgi:hypothetical protein
MEHCANRIGDAYFRTPRTTIKEFLNLLAVLEQNPGLDWRSPLGSVELAPEPNPDLEPLQEDLAHAPLASVTPLRTGTEPDDDLTAFRL